MYCTACGMRLDVGAHFCLRCGAPAQPEVASTASAYPRRKSSRVVVWWSLGVIVIAAGFAAFWFRSYLPPPAYIVGEWNGSVTSDGAGSYGSVTQIQLSITSIGLAGNLEGTISMQSSGRVPSSAPLSGHVFGRHVAVAANLSQSMTGAVRLMLAADGTVDGDVMDAQLRVTAGGSDQIATLAINSPLVFTRTPVAVITTPPPAQEAPTPPIPTPESTQAPLSTSQTQQAVDVVREYYRLWNQGDFRTMYGMFSRHLQAKNPYGLYVKYHSLVTQIVVEAEPGNLPSVVGVRIDSHNREKDDSISQATNVGQWNLVWEDGTWKLDSEEVHEVK